jgi:hypothetical protein
MIGKNALLAKYQSHWFWGIALFALFIELCFHAMLPVSISNDSYGYIALSRDLFSPNTSFERSVGYPVFLLLTGLNLFDNLIPVILVQAAMAVAIPLIVFKSLVRFGLGYAVIGALISCLYFYNFVLSLSVLTELAYGFSIAVYTFLLIAYFREMSLRNLLLVIASCWLIALIRMSGSLHFFSLLIGISFYILAQMSYKNWDNMKLGLRHLFIAIAVFASVSVVQHTITNRTSSVAWPHFVFNWVYKSGTYPAYLGIIKPENGPATKKLFDEVERIIREQPSAFDTLKVRGGSEKVKALKPERDKKYSPEAVKMLMDDLINNNGDELRSWHIEAVLINYAGGVLSASKMMGDAVAEAFKEHPRAVIDRLQLVFRERIGDFLLKGIEANEVILPTAYHHQVVKVIDNEPGLPVKPRVYMQWTYDMYNHTGTATVDRDVFYPNRYPSTFAGAMENIKTDNVIGFGHYVTVLGMQVLRLSWVLILVGLVIFPFTRQAPMLLSLLSASILPPVISVFLSETNARHLVMDSPLHLVTAIVVMYVVAGWFGKRAHG